MRTCGLLLVVLGCSGAIGSDRGADGGAVPDTSDDSGTVCFVEYNGTCTSELFPEAERSLAEICQLYQDEFPTRAQAVTQKAAKGCDPGEITDDARSDALRRTNFYRNLVGLEPIVQDAVFDSETQACALVQSRRGKLSHELSVGDPCYSESAAEAAASSNLAMGVDSPADAVSLYVEDPGVASLGHRRWVLFPDFVTTGFGWVDSFSCMWVFGFGARSDPPLVLWPPPGFVPYEIVGGAISVSAPSLGGVAVTVRDSGGVELGSTGELLQEGFGWSTMALSVGGGDSYEVVIQGIDLGDGPGELILRSEVHVCGP